MTNEVLGKHLAFFGSIGHCLVRPSRVGRTPNFAGYSWVVLRIPVYECLVYFRRLVWYISASFLVDPVGHIFTTTHGVKVGTIEAGEVGRGTACKLYTRFKPMIPDFGCTVERKTYGAAQLPTVQRVVGSHRMPVREH